MFTNYPIIRPIINHLYVTTPRKIDSFGSTISCFRKQRAIDRSIFHRGPTILLPIHFVTPFGIYPRVWKIRRMKNRGTGGGPIIPPDRISCFDSGSPIRGYFLPFPPSLYPSSSIDRIPGLIFSKKSRDKRKGEREGARGGSRSPPLPAI